jgi:DNA-binding NarL/FixJ family response regulator
MNKIKVIIVDDHPSFREGLARLLADEEDIECIATSGNGMEAVEFVKKYQPHVVLIDVSMPEYNGIDVTKMIKQISPGTSVLMLSAFNYESYILAALHAGAAGYMLKDSSLNELISAVRLVNNGDSVLGIHVTDKVMRHIVTANNYYKDGNHLNNREVEVIKLTAKGLGNKEIAHELCLSERTVQTHLFNIYRKLNANTRTKAVLTAIKLGYVSPDFL